MPIFNSLKDLETRRRSMRRRTFVSVLLAGAGAVLGYRWWKQRPQVLAQRPTRYVTPSRDFYTVSISNRYPVVNANTWRLRVCFGEKERQWSLEQIRGLSIEISKTVSCISNPIGGIAVGNALWTVTPLVPVLAGVLQGADPKDESLRVVFRGLDGFDSSVPIGVAMQRDAYLAYEMNGVALSPKHGFPLRVLLPGKYGMKQPRWLSEIEVTRDRVRGYWERRGWSEQADMRAATRIDSARPMADGAWKARGVAYCGKPAVGLVEVQLNDGPWHPARLTTPAREDTWVTWEWVWKAEPGRNILAARVTDANGRMQDDTDYWGAFPSGSTGLHRVIVEVPKVEPGRSH